MPRHARPDNEGASSIIRVHPTGVLSESVGFELVGPGLGRDLESALRTSLKSGVAFPEGESALEIFRYALSASIRDIESHPRGALFQRFLRQGPYEGKGRIPSSLRDKRLSDQECAQAITFIYSHMVNCFKGAVAELLATRPCLQLLRRLQRQGRVSAQARLYVGDSVAVRRGNGRGLLKGADLHYLILPRSLERERRVQVAGVVEVKSYRESSTRLAAQIDAHLRRAKRGICVAGVDCAPRSVTLGCGLCRRPVRVTVVPGDWKLPRTFRFEEFEGSRLLKVTPGTPPSSETAIEQIGASDWRITLRWSQEALAEAAYEMTFWYMEKVGEIIYAESVPKSWGDMSPAEAGRNAAKMMLYYAILRCRSKQETQRAIALYNAYGFGYALGMGFKNVKGRREMLWPEDLDEILEQGQTKAGCTLR